MSLLKPFKPLALALFGALIGGAAVSYATEPADADKIRAHAAEAHAPLKDNDKDEAPKAKSNSRDGNNVVRWDQKCVPYEDAAANRRLVDALAARNVYRDAGWNPLLEFYGERGWELVQLVADGDKVLLACFKRPRP